MSYMTKRSSDLNLSSWTDAGKALVLALAGAAAATGFVTGKIYQKATEPTDADFDNAQSSYGVGAARASLYRQVHRLNQERGMGNNSAHKSMRIME